MNDSRGKGTILLKINLAKPMISNKKIQIMVIRRKDGRVFFNKFIQIKGLAKNIKIGVEALPKELSLDPNFKGIPYEVYDILAKSNGFITIVVKGIQVLENVVSVQTIDMINIEPGMPMDQKIVIDIPEHNLVIERKKTILRKFIDKFKNGN